MSDSLQVSATAPTSERLSERLIVALDLPSGPEAIALAEQLRPLGVTFKVGMQLFYKEGMAVVRALQSTGQTSGSSVFLDLKLHDIPNTVAQATVSLVSQGVRFFNVHATGGPDMMSASVKAAREAAAENQQPDPTVIAVTLLTSISPQQLHTALQVHSSVEDYVVHLARQAQDCGLQGVVCSPQEAPLIRKACGEDFLLITPGIRPLGSASGDQARVLTPAQAMAAGADYLVIGRPITAAPNPLQAAQAILDEMMAVVAV